MSLLSCLFFMLLLSAAYGQPILDEVVGGSSDVLQDPAEEGQRAGSTGGGLFPTDVSSLASGAGPMMNMMKDGKLVMGGFSFVVIPNPDPSQLQGLASGGLPFMGALPMGGG